MLLAGTAGPAPAQAPGGGVQVQATRTERAGELVLSWPGPVAATHEQDGRDLTLRFDRPLGDAALEGIPAQLAGWVENVLYGYDSLLLVLADGTAATVEPTGDGVRVALTAAAPDAGTRRAREAVQADEERRLDYYRALTLMEEGHVLPARRLLSYLVATDPSDEAAVALLAAAEARLGRWRQAVRLYDRALDLTPGERSLVQAKAGLQRDYGDRVQLDVDHIRVHGADSQSVARLTGRADLGGDTGLHYTIEHRRIDPGRRPAAPPPPPPPPGAAPPPPPPPPPPANGPSDPFHRTRGELALVHDWPTLQTSRASLYLAEGAVGAGLTHLWRGASGAVTRAEARWNEPYWSLLEALWDGGVRHRVALAHERGFGDRWSASLAAGYNVYGLEGEDDLARSATVEGTLRYVIAAGPPQLTLAYTLDAEYVAQKAERLDPFGNVVAPLPLSSREVHALQVGLDGALADFVRYSVLAGYAYDRRNEGAPFAAAALVWQPREALEIGLRASRAVNTARGTGNAVDAVGGYVLWRY